MVYDYHEDDPRKCTSAKLKRFRLARGIRNLREIPRSAIVLNPGAELRISMEDNPVVARNGLVGLDCSWNRSEEKFRATSSLGQTRKLPALLAGNPVNYGVLGKLSTVEAFAAALIVTGFDLEAKRVLSLFKWGSTFLTLNREPLENYARTSRNDLADVENQFFSQR